MTTHVEGITSPPSIRIFLSYARQDDIAVPFAEDLKRILSHVVQGMSGRPVEFFLDQDSIPLGDNWSGKIDAGIRSSMFMIAAYSAVYVQRPACRDEFLKFRERAALFEVPKLLIPLVLWGSRSLLDEGQDEISDHVRNFQYVDFKDALIEGPQSAEFKRKIWELAERIVQVYSDSEGVLARKELEDARVEGASTTAVPELEDDLQDDDGLVELYSQFEERLGAITSASRLMGDALSEFGKVPDPPSQGQQSPAVASVYLIRVADAVKDPSLVVEAKGIEMSDLTRQLDEIIRRMCRLLADAGDSEGAKDLRAKMFDGIEELAELTGVVHQLESLLDSMKLPEVLSASVRKALRPARRGITASRDAIQIVTEWPSLVSGINETDQSRHYD